MTGYNHSHGDTDAVLMNLSNQEPMYRKLQQCVNIATWGDDNTWNDVDKAAADLRTYVENVQADAVAAGEEGGNFGEIVDANLAEVDFHEIVVGELRQKNLDEGRDADAGL